MILNLLDSNVWFYAFVDSQDLAKHLIAKDLIAGQGVLVAQQTIGEVCNSLLRKTRLGESELRSIVRSFYRHYQPIPLEEDDYLLASELRQKHKFSHWDSLLVAVAVRSGATRLYSEDMHNGLVVEGTTTIRNPFA